MKTFGGVIIVIFALIVILIGIVNFAFSEDDLNNIEVDKLTLEGNFQTNTERTCTKEFNKTICVDNIIVSCNGQSLKLPTSITGYIIHDEVIVEKSDDQCTQEIKNKGYGKELPSPKERINDDQITFYSDKVVIHVNKLKWRIYIDSNSMDPLIDEGTKTIEIKPKSSEEIQVGDIISYEVDDYDYAVVHRVVEIGNDEKGIYFITKGDNLKFNDEDKVRFEQIEGIVVGILY